MNMSVSERAELNDPPKMVYRSTQLSYDEIREGEWRGQEGLCDFYIKGEDVVVICQGKYVTTMKGAVINERIKNARRKKI